MNIFEQYGIKEVADVIFYEILADGTEKPALYLDTLKASTIEQTATQTDAKGGKGNPPLISWDYGKEITVNLEDALFSMKSMSMLYSNKEAVKISGDSTPVTINLTEEVVTGADGEVSLTMLSDDGVPENLFAHDAETGEDAIVEFDSGTDKVTIGTEANKKYRIFYTEQKKDPGGAVEITISAGTFPGTYKVTGTTYARSLKTGADEYFQFEIPRAKMGAEVTLTMEAEGDPSVFNMPLKVLRPADGKMMFLKKFTL